MSVNCKVTAVFWPARVALATFVSAAPSCPERQILLHLFLFQVDGQGCWGLAGVANASETALAPLVC